MSSDARGNADGDFFMRAHDDDVTDGFRDVCKFGQLPVLRMIILCSEIYAQVINKFDFKFNSIFEHVHFK